MTTGTNTPLMVSAMRSTRSLGGSGLIHHLDDMGQGGIGSYGNRLHLKRQHFTWVAPMTWSPGRFFTGTDSPVMAALVHIGLALTDHAIHRNK